MAASIFCVAAICAGERGFFFGAGFAFAAFGGGAAFLVLDFFVAIVRVHGRKNATNGRDSLAAIVPLSGRRGPQPRSWSSGETLAAVVPGRDALLLGCWWRVGERSEAVGRQRPP